MRITVTIEVGREGAASLFGALAGILGDGDTVAVNTVPAAPEPEPAQEADAPKRRTRRKAEQAAETPDPEAPPVDKPTLTLVETVEETPAAFEAIMAAQEQEEVPADFDYETARATIRGLMIDTLGLSWARRNVLPDYGSLSGVPDRALPDILALAQADAAEATAGGFATWGDMVTAREAEAVAVAL